MKEEKQGKMTEDEKEETIRKTQEDIRKRNRRSPHSEECRKELCLNCAPTARCL